MVLEDPYQSGGATDGSPISNVDPYSNPELDGNSNSPFARYPTNITLPEGGFWNTLFFARGQTYNRKLLERTICSRMDLAIATVNRFPTQEETDAFVDQAGFSANGSSLGAGIGIFLGLKRAAEGARTGGPNTRVAPGGIINIHRWPMFAANALPRTLGWIIAGNFLGRFGGQAFTMAYSQFKMSSDPRLEKFRTDVSSQDIKEVQRRYDEMLKQRLRAARAKQLAPYAQPAQAGTVEGNASPTGGYAQNYPESSGSYTQQRETQSYSESPSQAYSSPSYSQQASSSFSSYGNDEQKAQDYSTPQKSSGRGFWDDDASPVNPEVPADPQPSQPPGSTWARIRRDAANQSPASGRNYQDAGYQSNSGHDSFSYSNSQTDNQLPREQAQREFDSLIESDRKGEDAGNGQRSGWRRN